ncbi:hypothetical protein SLE2022_054210 [Rubroshorea leprosula]
MQRAGKSPSSSSGAKRKSKSQGEGVFRMYMQWTKEMDNILAISLYDSLSQGLKIDKDWKPQAYQAAVDYLAKSLSVNVTKEQVKNKVR